MNCRGFLKDLTEKGIAGGIAGSLLDNHAASASPYPRDQSQSIHGRDNLGADVATSVIDLSGKWLIVQDPQNIGREERWFSRPAPDGLPVRVPGVFQEVFPAYHGVVWYWRQFTAPAHPHAQGRYLVQFGAVAYFAEVWINGVRVGEHEGSETPFELDVTHAISPQPDGRAGVEAGGSTP